MKGVGHQYDPQAPLVVKDIDLDIHPHEFVAVVGPTGCGKSTLLRMVSGLLIPSQGEVSVFNRPVTEPRDDVGIVFQKANLLPWLTVRKNVLFPLKHKYGSYSAADEKRANELLEMAGLTQFADKMPDELSGGMKQRLAIAQAIICKPRILLLDEPFGALDPGIRGDMHKLILDLWKEHNLTIFMVTHDLKEGFHLGTRLWVFDKIRHDPQAPNAYGASITYDLPVGESDTQTYDDLHQQLTHQKQSTKQT